MFKEKMVRHVKFRGTMTKWPVQKQTQITTQKHVEHPDATYIQKKHTIFCVFRIFLFYIIFIYNFLNDFSKKCLVTATVNDFHLELNQF